MCTNFQTKRTNLNFWAQICPKIDVGVRFQKSNSGFGFKTSIISYVPIFSQNRQHLVFDLNLGKLSSYVQYFGWNILEGVAESWVEVEMSWVEVDGVGWWWVHSLVILFDGILKNLSLVVSYTPVMLHSQWHYCSWSLHYTRDIPGTRLHLIPWGWRWCIPPYPLLPVSDVCPCITSVRKLFAQLCCCLGLQLHWR